MKGRVLVAGVAVVAAAQLFAGEDDWFKPLGLPPKAAPRRISGGEGVPPLPLPATPLRRTERKREPRPPTLVTKIVWGETAGFTYDDGNKTDVADWNQCPADIQQLLRKGEGRFGFSYTYDAVPLAEFHGDPEKAPLILYNGSRTLKMDDKQVAKLRAYVLKGGMVLFDSIAGSPFFHDSAVKIAARAFPECEVRVVPRDHPVYHILYDVNQVRYPRNLDSTQPYLQAVYVGSHIGMLISKYGLGCAWDDHEVPLIKESVYYDEDSGNKIGLNILAYAIGYANAAREEAKPELFGAMDEKHPTDEFVFAQIEHEGSWNAHPGAAAALLTRIRQNTSMRVSLKRVAVTPGKDDLSGYSFLFLSGLADFKWDDKAVAALREFLRHSGTLFVNNGLGMRDFDVAARRELKKVLPDFTLSPVPADHAIYRSVFNIKESRYTAATMKEYPILKTPSLEGIAVDGDIRVVYSQFDIEAAWLGCEYPLAKAYEQDSGMRLGMNIAMYAVTH